MVSLFSHFRHAASADGDGADDVGIRVLKSLDVRAGAAEFDPVQVPIGTWLSAAILDPTSGLERPARILVAAGVNSAAPAALSGWVDWAEQHEQQMRTALIHAASMAVSVGLYGGSWAAHSGGHQKLGRALGFAGLMVAGCGATLGGHLAYRLAPGTN